MVGWLHVKENPRLAQDLGEQQIVIGRERVTGVIVLQVDVDREGRVINVVPVSGSPELDAAFIDQTRRIRFYPFKREGGAVCVRFSVRYGAVRGLPDEPGFSKFKSLLGKCSKLSQAKAGSDTLEACHAAADAADRLSSPLLAKGSVEAYTYYASALLIAHRFQDALLYADKAVAKSDAGFTDITDKALACGIRGQARAILGDSVGSESDLEDAENLERATFEVPRSPEQRKFDVGVLRATLSIHAAFLAKSGKTNEAAKLREEAQRL